MSNVGKTIVEKEQSGKIKAEYGKANKEKVLQLAKEKEGQI